MLRAKTPLPLQGCQRLYSVFAGLFSFGASCQRNTMKLMSLFPSSTRLLTTRGLRYDFGKKGVSLAICASLSQKISIMPQLATPAP